MTIMERVRETYSTVLYGALPGPREGKTETIYAYDRYARSWPTYHTRQKSLHLVWVGTKWGMHGFTFHTIKYWSLTLSLTSVEEHIDPFLRIAPRITTFKLQLSSNLGTRIQGCLSYENIILFDPVSDWAYTYDQSHLHMIWSRVY